MILDVYVPKPNTLVAAMVDPGSALVSGAIGQPDHEIICDYEGNRYKAINLNALGGPGVRAARRHVGRYPTMARSTFMVTDLIQDGEIDTEMWSVMVEHSQETCDALTARGQQP